jgi:uncharacterized membrane protein YqjE
MTEMRSEPSATADGQTELHERPAAELVRELSAQVSTLVRQELELARVELAAKGKEAGLGAGMFGGAGLMALYGVGAVVAAAILALATAVAAWLAAIIVAVVLFAIAGVLALLGKSHAKRAGPPAPEQAMRSVKEDVRVTKEHVQDARHHHHHPEAAR